MKRRKMLKGLGALSAAGLMAFDAGSFGNFNPLSDLELNGFDDLPDYEAGEELRLGLIGFGIRGQQLARAAGFATQQWQQAVQEAAKTNKKDTRWEDFASRPNLNCKFTGYCEIYSTRASLAGYTLGPDAKMFTSYQALMASSDIDAVIIATPDHLHVPMALEAIRNGKHVYVEKCLSHTIDQAVRIYRAVAESNIKLQLGHQLRQTASYHAAKELIAKDVLGKITLIQTNSNRNSANGAWAYEIPEDASEATVDWPQFAGEKVMKFDADRFFRWRKYWDYGTGLLGDLMTHDFDAVNQIMELGIPESVVSSGGIYYWKDRREVPDVLQVVMEYPERNLTYNYSATQANQRHRPNIIMGSDATMEIGAKIAVFPDPQSKKYRQKLHSGELKPTTSLIDYDSNVNNEVDGVSSATSKYFLKKGMMYTNEDGRRVNPTYLHIREWLESIRQDSEPSCNIHEAFVEAVSTHMAVAAYKMSKKVFWDADKKKIYTS